MKCSSFTSKLNHFVEHINVSVVSDPGHGAVEMADCIVLYCCCSIARQSVRWRRRHRSLSSEAHCGLSSCLASHPIRWHGR